MFLFFLFGNFRKFSFPSVLIGCGVGLFVFIVMGTWNFKMDVELENVFQSLRSCVVVFSSLVGPLGPIFSFFSFCLLFFSALWDNCTILASKFLLNFFPSCIVLVFKSIFVLSCFFKRAANDKKNGKVGENSRQLCYACKITLGEFHYPRIGRHVALFKNKKKREMCRVK